ncbi:1-aminocyclopropane-1-carboxylate deaminase/D-cysteine desulfhydrase [Colwellia psychrerythraea]|uniref:Pyridoxal-5'-phosphate-dependent protein beta subunit n=1 Tax=Colwellia psychrerythraea TaxID=28229 RepID=A0A099KRT6_COLPS|nr:pyridoxal-phosphate dependent enzyme [Colwellia psychrerythraea]KGJ92378.1 Pyridoxal-5'-phosphate-dependent protein beta subunit [Colwellia psychrerythraea]
MFKPLSITHKIHHPIFDKYKVDVQVKRDDLLHNIISGNKWRKLKYNLKQLKDKHCQGALTFGGSYSNHIHAFAYACKQANIPCIGIIRGEERYQNNFTLSWARHWGMQCHFVDRKTYRRRFETEFYTELNELYPRHFIIPEGGSNSLAIPGVAEILTELNSQTDFDTLMTPVGSGGTLAGLISGDSVANSQHHQILGVAVLKQADYLIEEIKQLLTVQGKKHDNWQLLTNFHRGGYGKFSENDSNRIIEFNQQTGVTFEPVYSGKMILALLDLLEQGYFKQGERIILLHTGGLQGLGGMIEQGRLNAEDWPVPPRAPLY